MSTRLTIRLDFSAGRRLGAGKVALLEAIEKAGSISAAGRAHEMSYRRAWLLVDELNSYFRQPVVVTRLGGTGGGTAVVTTLGQSVIRAYRAMEQNAERMVRRRSAPLLAQLRETPARARRKNSARR